MGWFSDFSTSPDAQKHSRLRRVARGLLKNARGPNSLPRGQRPLCAGCSRRAKGIRLSSSRIPHFFMACSRCSPSTAQDGLNRPGFSGLNRPGFSGLNRPGFSGLNRPGFSGGRRNLPDRAVQPHATHSSVANSTSSRFRQGPQCRITSVRPRARFPRRQMERAEGDRWIGHR
jgi:hypothetical protein